MSNKHEATFRLKKNNDGRFVRLFTVPYFFVRSFRYTASYRHGYSQLSHSDHLS